MCSPRLLIAAARSAPTLLAGVRQRKFVEGRPSPAWLGLHNGGVRSSPREPGVLDLPYTSGPHHAPLRRVGQAAIQIWPSFVCPGKGGVGQEVLLRLNCVAVFSDTIIANQTSRTLGSRGDPASLLNTPRWVRARRTDVLCSVRRGDG